MGGQMGEMLVHCVVLQVCGVDGQVQEQVSLLWLFVRPAGPEVCEGKGRVLLLCD